MQISINDTSHDFENQFTSIFFNTVNGTKYSPICIFKEKRLAQGERKHILPGIFI